MIRIAVAILMVAGLCGCRAFSNRCVLTDHYHEYHSSGEIRVGTGYHWWDHGTLWTQRDYFTNGRLRSLTISLHGHKVLPRANGSTVSELHFHENGRLKSEEHFYGSEIAYAAVYDQEGNMKSEHGHKVRPRDCRGCTPPIEAP